MRITNPDGREFAHISVFGLPLNAPLLEVSVDLITWVPTTYNADKTSISFLVAGPSALDNPDGTLVCQLGRSVVQLRAIDSPERLYRTAGSIYITAGA